MTEPLSAFVTAMQAALDRVIQADTPADRKAAEADWARFIQRHIEAGRASRWRDGRQAQVGSE